MIIKRPAHFELPHVYSSKVDQVVTNNNTILLYTVNVKIWSAKALNFWLKNVQMFKNVGKMEWYGDNCLETWH